MPFGPAAAPTLFTVEIYPYEGGHYTLQGGQILRAIVRKNLRDIQPGTFQIELAPGGPGGTESSPTWSEIITPQSFVLLGGQRGNSAAVMLAGVVTTVSETQQWQTSDDGTQAARRQTILGQDFTWFFNSFNWYALAYLGLTAGAALGPAGIPVLLNDGLVGGSSSADSNPARVGAGWYQNVMAGASGILGNTYLPYQGSQVPFRTAVSTIWEQYSNVFIPFGDFYWASEGSWSAKFDAIFPRPFYEFFVATAPSGAYSSTVATANNLGAAGQQFSMAALPAAAAAGPVVVARVNPTPTLNATVPGAGSTPILAPGLDMSRWTQLPLYDFTAAPFGFLNSAVGFNSDDARNFYMLNPTWQRAMFGDNNGNISPFLYYMAGMGDARSIGRYGYRPQIGTIRWLADLNGNAAQNVTLNIAQSVATLTAVMASWYQPLPMMARGTVTIPFSPDVLIGSRFRYQPFKGQLPWDFYIEEVVHEFLFGGPSNTTLALSRGLPQAVYADSAAGGKLEALHLGTAGRVDGAYTVVSGASTPALTPLSSPESIKAFLGNIAAIYVSPQAGGG